MVVRIVVDVITFVGKWCIPEDDSIILLLTSNDYTRVTKANVENERENVKAILTRWLGL